MNTISSQAIAYNLQTINSLLDSADADVTFWGLRTLTFNIRSHHSLTLGIKTNNLVVFADNVQGASGIRRKALDLQTNERIAGIELMNKLKNFHQITDTKITQANWFTRLLNFIREFTFYSLPMNKGSLISPTCDDNFRAYSENQYIQAFGQPKDFSFSGGIGALVPESEIRKLVQTAQIQTTSDDNI